VNIGELVKKPIEKEKKEKDEMGTINHYWCHNKYISFHLLKNEYISPPKKKMNTFLYSYFCLKTFLTAAKVKGKK